MLAGAIPDVVRLLSLTSVAHTAHRLCAHPPTNATVLHPTHAVTVHCSVPFLSSMNRYSTIQCHLGGER